MTALVALAAVVAFCALAHYTNETRLAVRAQHPVFVNTHLLNWIGGTSMAIYKGFGFGFSICEPIYKQNIFVIRNKKKKKILIFLK